MALPVHRRPQVPLRPTDTYADGPSGAEVHCGSGRGGTGGATSASLAALPSLNAL